ncbi:MAG: lipoate--protein ligase family protein [Chlamydiae bacterium]|nr:lipoate--protein ligase family protein [Chlamydiota bacterium]
MQLHIIRLQNVPIFTQLLLEEQLLRQDTRNFCLLNTGSSPAIVMGISGKPKLLIHQEQLQNKPIPVIRRFSGGGTVVVDEDTLFVSFICNKDILPHLAYPEKILEWSASLYAPALAIPGFALRENDFVIHQHKCGGNAQYITKDRFLQHTSFLWDFSHENMSYLLHPPKAPTYREGRTHSAFLCTLKEYFSEKNHPLQEIDNYLQRTHEVSLLSQEEIYFSSKIPSRTHTLPPQEIFLA